ncbi:MAG: formylglycine-generating enzyme family protein [Deltaproteobacteria bacterium]|nr:formylglycine-generating enzyme family protein [Deltaproteobacteria bacterium]
MARERYTKYPRPILWLVPGGDLLLAGGSHAAIEPFYISKFPVSNEQFEAFDPGFLRSDLSADDSDPAIGVSLQEAQEYCAWYSEVSRKNMRLPSEEEWEYACRGGSPSRFFWGDDPTEADDFLWDADNSDGQLHPADAKRANEFGLFGMLGSVWEWVAPEPGEDGEQAPLERHGVLRGGSFQTPRKEISCSLRKTAGDTEAVEGAGFRIVKSLR